VAKSPHPRELHQGRSQERACQGRPAGRLFTWLAIGSWWWCGGARHHQGHWRDDTQHQFNGIPAADPTTVAEVTHVPMSVFNTVGVTSPVALVTPPLVLKDSRR